MSTALPPVPVNVQAVDSGGIFTRVFAEWLQKLFERVGKNVAQSNTELYDYMLPRLVPIATMLPFAGTSAPTGFLLCDGSAVSRTTYADLYGVIGTTYGSGDGSTTFNLPSTVGKFLVGKNSGTFTPIGGTGGAESQNLPNHVHTSATPTGAPSATATVQSGAGATVASSTHTHAISSNTGNPTTTPAISTLPPYMVSNFIIKT